MCSLICIWLLQFKRKWAEKVDRATFSAEWKSAFKPVFHLANLFARTEKKATWLAGDKHWRHHQPITFVFCLFVRTNSPSRKPPLVMFHFLLWCYKNECKTQSSYILISANVQSRCKCWVLNAGLCIHFYKTRVARETWLILYLVAVNVQTLYLGEKNLVCIVLFSIFVM